MELSELMEIIDKKPISLFYGAGVSMACGGPSGSQLFSAIRKQFKGPEIESFFDYMDKIMKFDDSNRSEIEAFIIDQLASISPEESHRYLFSLPWRAILTTNYDRLPELVLETLDKNRTIISKSDPDDSDIDQTKSNLLYCFKLFGDVRYKYPIGGWIVLTNSDYRIAYNRRSKFIELFSNLAISGHVIYLGYSFNDHLVFDILREIKHILNRIPWQGYAITPNKPTEEMQEIMQNFGITWVKGNLDEFVTITKKFFGNIPISAPSLVRRFSVHNIPIELDQGTATNIWRKFKILTVDYLHPFSENPIHFFEGIDSSLYPFVNGWDYPRKVKLVSRAGKKSKISDKFNLESIIHRSESGNSRDNIIISLTGSAGSGKTVVSKRIAFNWYKRGNPVIFLNTEVLSIDETSLLGLLDEIWKKYNLVFESENKSAKELRFLLVADNGDAHLENLVKLKNHLISTGKPADILLVARKSKLTRKKILDYRIDIAIEIDDTISANELIPFRDHFNRYRVLEDPEIVGRNIVNSEINSSFFALVYTSVKGVSKPLKQVITEEYNDLDSESKRFYSTVSFLQSLNLTPHTSLCIKCGDFDYDKIERKVEDGGLSGIINHATSSTHVSSLEFNGDSFLANNRIIADIIYTHAFRTSTDIFEILKKMINSITIDDIVETNLLHNLLIDRVRAGQIPDLEVTQSISLFKLAIKKIKTRPLLHHLAKLQIESGNYNEAAISIDTALNTHNDKFHEPEEYALDSRGRLELRLAQESMSDADIALTHLEKAAQAFHDAAFTPQDTPHPYQGLGKTYLHMAQLSHDEVKMSYYLLALQQCSFVENYLGQDLDSQLLSIKEDAIYELDKMGFDEQKADLILKHLGDSNGYAFLAEYWINQNSPQKAVSLVNKGLKENSKSTWLVRIKATLIRQMEPENYTKLRDVLERYIQLNGPFNIMLYFELAMVTFKLEEYDVSLGYFDQIYEKSKKHRYRLTPIEKNRWTENRSPKEFKGELVEPPKGQEYGKIKCHTLPDYPRLIDVRKKDIEFDIKGKDLVIFNLTFNMQGPQASRVRKL